MNGRIVGLYVELRCISKDPRRQQHRLVRWFRRFTRVDAEEIHQDFATVTAFQLGGKTDLAGLVYSGHRRLSAS